METKFKYLVYQRFYNYHYKTFYKAEMKTPCVNDPRRYDAILKI